MTKHQAKRELMARKKDKITSLQDNLDEVFYLNMKGLVDPSSAAAKKAQKMEIASVLDPEFTEKLRQDLTTAEDEDGGKKKG